MHFDGRLFWSFHLLKTPSLFNCTNNVLVHGTSKYNQSWHKKSLNQVGESKDVKCPQVLYIKIEECVPPTRITKLKAHHHSTVAKQAGKRTAHNFKQRGFTSHKYKL
jgi:hypothetical protein